MKVYFDIITNHTADVIELRGGRAARPYVSKDAVAVQDGRGHAVRRPRLRRRRGSFPALDPAASFPYTPVRRPAAERTSRSPTGSTTSTLYHNRGDTTFDGEDSLYGDFFGLDDLFTEHPRVVAG